MVGGGCLTHFKLIRRLRRHISLKRSVGMGGGVGYFYFIIKGKITLSFASPEKENLYIYIYDVITWKKNCKSPSKYYFHLGTSGCSLVAMYAVKSMNSQDMTGFSPSSITFLVGRREDWVA
jgi:hypothetical protein